MNKTLRKSVATSLAAAGIVVTAGASSAFAATLNMSGGTFPQIAYKDFCANGGDCNYSGVGSGTGIRNLINGVNTLIGSDATLTADQQAQLGAPPVYVPTLLGAISVPVNVSGVTGNRLKLTGQQVGDIFAGNITNWKQLRTGLNAKAAAAERRDHRLRPRRRVGHQLRLQPLPRQGEQELPHQGRRRWLADPALDRSGRREEPRQPGCRELRQEHHELDRLRGPRGRPARRPRLQRELDRRQPRGQGGQEDQARHAVRPPVRPRRSPRPATCRRRRSRRT